MPCALCVRHSSSHHWVRPDENLLSLQLLPATGSCCTLGVRRLLQNLGPGFSKCSEDPACPNPSRRATLARSPVIRTVGNFDLSGGRDFATTIPLAWVSQRWAEGRRRLESLEGAFKSGLAIGTDFFSGTTAAFNSKAAEAAGDLGDGGVQANQGVHAVEPQRLVHQAANPGSGQQRMGIVRLAENSAGWIQMPALSMGVRSENSRTVFLSFLSSSSSSRDFTRLLSWPAVSLPDSSSATPQGGTIRGCRSTCV